jgi:multidrug efflux system outer membrane protein
VRRDELSGAARQERDAQRSALAADRAAAQIRTGRLLAAVAVARSLGAGWQAPTALAQAN